jgi:hypothetical protein
MREAARVLFGLWLVLFLVGCASISPEAKLKHGYEGLSAAVKTATLLLQRQAIDVAEAERVLEMADSAKALLDQEATRLKACRAQGGTDCEAEGINLGLAILLELEKYLEEKEQGK